MKLLDARHSILAGLYARSRLPDSWTDRQTFLADSFANPDDPAAVLVLGDLIEKKLVKERGSEISLSVDGCYEAEKLDDIRSYPHPEKTSNYIALYSATVATYLVLVATVPSAVGALLMQYCTSFNVGHSDIGTSWGRIDRSRIISFDDGVQPGWCSTYILSFGHEGLGSYLSSHVLWAVLLALAAFLFVRRISRRWSAK